MSSEKTKSHYKTLPDELSSRAVALFVSAWNRIGPLLFTLGLGLALAFLAIHWTGLERPRPMQDDRWDKGILGEAPEELPQCRADRYPDRSCLGTPKPLCEKDLEIARIAWRYFEVNYQPDTGLVNAADKYPSTTMWDTGSALAATLAALELGLIKEKEFDDRIMALLSTLNTMELFNGEAPNKVYHAATGKMVDYKNNPSPDGIGVSALDLGRMLSWLNILSCLHPKYKKMAEAAILRWKYCRLIKDGQMYGLARDRVTKEIKVVQEGRLGYEQYAGKIFRMLGFDQHVAASYKNEFATQTQIYGIPIAIDVRDPRVLGAYNYVVTESYALDAMENGLDPELNSLFNNIYEVQKRRWEDTGQVTAVSEDNLDRPPYFVYNTIFVAGTPWLAITDTGKDTNHLKTVSVKAALALALLRPDDPYSDVLFDYVRNAYDPERGWYSGIYERGLGYNKAITANTNGIILSMMLHKRLGALNKICSSCQQGILLTPKVANAPEYEDRCLPGRQCANACPTPASTTP